MYVNKNVPPSRNKRGAHRNLLTLSMFIGGLMIEIVLYV